MRENEETKGTLSCRKCRKLSLKYLQRMVLHSGPYRAPQGAYDTSIYGWSYPAEEALSLTIIILD